MSVRALSRSHVHSHLQLQARQRLVCTATSVPPILGQDLQQLAAPASEKLQYNGWVWLDDISCDDNYMELAFLLARNSTSSGKVGCVLVAGVEDGAAKRQQGKVLVCGVNSWFYRCEYACARGVEINLTTKTACSVYSPERADCHAEANAIAESAAHGLALHGASCYVSKPPCRRCFTLLAVAGIAHIVSPDPMETVLQRKRAASFGITTRLAGLYSPFDKERRNSAAEPHLDRDLVRVLRDERRNASDDERFTAHMQRLGTRGKLHPGSDINGGR